MAEVWLESVTRTYPGTERPAVDELSVQVPDGQLLVLTGPSGCGKSTALRMLAGLEEVDGGRILLDGQDVTHLPPKDRDVAMVLQNYALYPHLSVADNMGFALRVAGSDPTQVRERVEQAAAVLDLGDHLDQAPADLTGEERQRVALGRAVVRDPQVFIMDEPLASLDPDVRARTRAQLTSLRRSLGVTTLYATDDPVEALELGDQVAVLRDGRLTLLARPEELRVDEHGDLALVTPAG